MAVNKHTVYFLSFRNWLEGTLATAFRAFPRLLHGSLRERVSVSSDSPVTEEGGGEIDRVIKVGQR